VPSTKELAAKQAIQSAVQSFSSGSLAVDATKFFDTLGYRSNLTLRLSGDGKEEFLEAFDLGGTFRRDKALWDEWTEIRLLFQLTADHISDQHVLFTNQSVDKGNPLSYLFFAVGLHAGSYARGKLAQITREINKLTKQPALILFKHGGSLTLAVIDRRLHLREPEKDVLKKVTLIKDINIAQPHRAHIEILFDLSLAKLASAHQPLTTFAEMHDAWRATLNISELNKRFYRRIADWFYWAVDNVEYPLAPGINDQQENDSINVIRLLTRIIFVWFLREKNLVPDDIFDKKKLEGILKDADLGSPKKSNYYRGVLQNLFFATLNQKMNSPKEPKNREWVSEKHGPKNQNDDFTIVNKYRFPELFKNPEEFLQLVSTIPFLNGGLFDCLDKGNENMYVDGFTRRPRFQPVVPNMLFFGNERTVDLSKVFEDKKRSKEPVKGLIHILNDYKFTIAENTPIEEEVALDPELLGRVFENLLAAYNPETGTTARKTTGSFYTPREIVNYMVDESLIAYLETKLNDLTPNPSPNGEGNAKPRYMTSEPSQWKYLKVLAREHRKNPTEAENVLWQRLRNNRLGAHFRRQHAIDWFIADFVCIEKKLVVELDGEIHKEQREYDAERTEYLNSHGFRVIRFWNDEVLKNSDGIIAKIRQTLDNPASAPLPTGEGTGVGPINDTESKLRHLISYSDEPHQFSPSETDVLIDAIHTMNVLDPACGSGAFPMGVLLKVVHVLHKLDPENQKWKQKQIDAAEQIPDSSIRQETFANIDEAFSEENNFADYGRKLYLIENCIFGVDIQPIAVQIAKLRFFISLLVDQHGDVSPNLSPNPSPFGRGGGVGSKPNRGVLSLPNLETKFVAANTLIGIEQRIQATMVNTDVQALEQKLNAVRKGIFSARSYREKKELQALDKKFRGELAELIRQKAIEAQKVIEKQIAEAAENKKANEKELKDPSLLSGKRKQYEESIKRAEREIEEKRTKLLDTNLVEANARRLAEWDPYDQNAHAEFFDQAWMFGMSDGFDIILGNPPYVRQEELKELKPLLASQFECYTGTSDLYVYFWEKGVKLLKSDGTITYISSNKFFRAAYGEKLRQFLTKQTALRTLIDFGDRPVFEATTYPCVLVASRSRSAKPEDNFVKAKTIETLDELERFEEVVQASSITMCQSDLGVEGWRIEDRQVLGLLEKIKKAGVALEEYVHGKIYYGIKTGYNEAFVIDGETKKRLIKENKASAEVIKPFLRGRDIKRYAIDETGLHLLFIPWHFPLHQKQGIEGASKEAENKFKVEYPAVYKHLEAYKKELEQRNEAETGVRYEWYALQRCAASYWKELERPKIVWGNLGDTAGFSFDQNSQYVSAPACMISVPDMYLLGLLNSMLGDYFFHQIAATRRGGYLEYKPMYVEQLPIATPSEKQCRAIEERVEKILAAKKKDDKADTSVLEKEIDVLVYKLYGLTYEEVKTVESDFEMSNEEFERVL